MMVVMMMMKKIGSDGDVLLTPYVPKGITGYDDDDDEDINIKKAPENNESHLSED
jgi:hypothetical protein